MINYDSIFLKYQSIFIYGKTKTGKTTGIIEYVKDKDYTYKSIQELKNEKQYMEILETQNIYNMFHNNVKNKKYIIVDNIDYLQTNDKKMLNYFIKFFKQGQQLKYKNIYFIFIGTNIKEKKVLELFEQIDYSYEMKSNNNIDYDKVIKEQVLSLLEFKDLHVKGLPDKNIISLCYHENIIAILNNNLTLYEIFLENFCCGDYYDRISFKKQLWQLNEITFYLKVVYNSYLLKDKIILKSPLNVDSILFTKILTKFSNEYSNQNFIISICNKLKCQKEQLYNLIDYNDSKLEELTIQEKKRIFKLYNKTYS
tara:strand:- start:49 stop:981 length:933 start_codon:yes stop_codon:yes gene_type:complete